MPKKNTVVGLDVGTTKVYAVVGEVDDNGQVRVLGAGESGYSGLRRGIIVDIEHTARAIGEAVEKAEQMSGLTVGPSYVSISGVHAACTMNRGVVAVAGPDKEISAEDAQRVLQAARVLALPAERRILHVLPREFIVDGYDGIVDPVGMAGSRLEVETQVITVAATALQNLLKSVQRAGVEIEEVVLAPLASAEAVLTPAERELGAVVVDIGGGTTEIALYERGSLWFTSILPVGGELITSDLAVGLRTPLAEAEAVKKQHGAVLASLQPDDEMVQVRSVGGQATASFSRRFVASIIEPRVEEIFSLVKQELQRAGYQGLLPGGLVLTGGTAQLAGITQLAMQALDMPVRLGVPGGVGGMSDLVSAPQHATGVGLLLWGAKTWLATRNGGGEALWGGFWGRIRSWLRDFF